MRDRLIFAGQFVFTLIVAAFLIVPAVLSMLAGVTANYFRGIASGLTLQWVMQVWNLYAETIARSCLVAAATLLVTLVVGVPAAYALNGGGGRLPPPVERIIPFPLAFPGPPSRPHCCSPMAASAISAARGCSSSPATSYSPCRS